jgi:glycosyltransferase involved in cell wall biosynthesis
MNKSQYPNIFLYKFKGNYGGDKYEDWLYDCLKKVINIVKIEEPRLGGVKSFFSLSKLLVRAFLNSGMIIRPFGLPIYRVGMVVIFHHYDHTDLRWYARAVENFDLYFLKLMSRRMNIKFLCVSKYWKDWLAENCINTEFLIFNTIEVDVPEISNHDRERIAAKYSLDPSLKWVFLGGHQVKKGGERILRAALSANFLTEQYQFIFSGKNQDNIGYSSVIWLDDVDYFGFLLQLHIVVANSQFREGWCRIVHEALVCGVPVVGSGAGGMGEIFELVVNKKSYSEDEILQAIVNPPKVTSKAVQNLVNLIEDNNAKQFQNLKNYLSCT